MMSGCWVATGSSAAMLATLKQSLLGRERIDLIFTDPPYNVPIDGHVCGLGKVQHREFAMAAGEMSEAAFTSFLTDALEPAAKMCRDGAIAFVCMDWRHMGELLAAGRQVFDELKNLIVWNKTNGGMGTFYRSKHELIFAFKVGKGEHTNSFGLGDTGRYLAPDITAAITEGRQPPTLTGRRLLRAADVPLSWDEQRRYFGFE